MKTRIVAALIAATLAPAVLAPNALATDEIIRPFRGIRTMGMGGVLYTTGLYEENFFGNAARVTANPQWKVQLLHVQAEDVVDLIGNAGDLTSSDSSNPFSALSGTAGDNVHIRAQLVPFAVYVPRERFAWAFGFLVSAQGDPSLRNSYRTQLDMVIDANAALNVGYKFLEDKSLAAGATLTFGERISTQNGLTMVDLIQGKSPDLARDGKEGMQIDVNLGGTYRLPFELWDFKFDGALALNNVLGGTYNMGSLGLVNGIGTGPLPQPRTVSLGISGKTDALWKFTDMVVALELTDIGNSHNGSVFKHLHLGTEAKWSVLRPRFGINQGYLCLGLGVDLKVFDFDLAYYGEELGQTVGAREDRRLAVRIGFNI